MRKRTQLEMKYFDEVYKMADFPVFQYYDHNKKEFEPRALNKMSTRFIDYIASELKDLKSKKVKMIPNEAWAKAMTLVISASFYAYFYNASYEAIGQNDNAHCGGDNSIQEQFVCWATGISVEDYRSGEFDIPLHATHLLDVSLNKLEKDYAPLATWAKDSQLFKLIEKITKPKSLFTNS